MDLQETMRKHFRINVKGNSDITVKINDAKYDVIDVGNYGIGIKFGPEDILFTVKDELSVELKIMGEIHNLQGKVVHINPEGPKDFLCGIKFIDLDKKVKEKLIDFMQACREKIFKEG